MVDIICKLIYNIDANCLIDEKSPYRKLKNGLFKYSKVTEWVWKKWKTKRNDFVWRKNLMQILKSGDKSELSILMRALTEPCDQNDVEIHEMKTLEKILRILIDKLRQLSSTLIFCLYELAKNPTVQEKLRAELRENFSDDCSYLMETNTFLHNVIQETLRLHPISSVLRRDCDFPDDEEEGYSLAPFYKYKVPRKMPFLIPVHAILRDEKLFTNADNFNPDRYSEKIHEILPLFLSHHLEGSNTTKFVVAVIKLFICNIIRNFKINLSDDQNDSINYNPMSVMLLPNDLILMFLEQI
ncbi:probable cytochrome P450 6t3 [Culicoides brevitarsis]|uniref:probable cytochrome P450 6t3 n=1 Tax=Culicoides brevitarsis TaxID=469753 RepID=UPI00307C3DB8